MFAGEPARVARPARLTGGEGVAHGSGLAPVMIRRALRFELQKEESEMSGWVMIHRKIQDWKWYKKPHMYHLFSHLILKAKLQDAEWSEAKIKRGQCVTGQMALSSETGIPENSIRTCLKRLEKTGEIVIESAARYSVITICNYNLYQNAKPDKDQMSGWVKIHRKIQDWKWYKEPHMYHLFSHLILKANHKPRKWKSLDMKRGQVITGRNALSSGTGISHRSIRTCQRRLEHTGEIVTNPTNHYTAITICNYDSYQDYDSCNDQQTTSKRPASDQHTTTNKNERMKEGKKKKNPEERERATPPISREEEEFEAMSMETVMDRLANTDDLPESVIMIKPHGLLQGGVVLEKVQNDPLGCYRSLDAKWYALPWKVRRCLDYGVMAKFEKKEARLMGVHCA